MVQRWMLGLFLAMLFACIVVVGCSGRNAVINEPSSKTSQHGPFIIRRLANGNFEVRHSAPNHSVLTMEISRHQRFFDQAVFAKKSADAPPPGNPTPTPGPTIGTDNVWVTANYDYVEQWFFQTNDSKCTTVSFTTSANVPGATLTPPPPTPPNTYYYVSFGESNPSSPPPAGGNYSETVTGTCNDGYQASGTVSVGVVHVDWIDVNTNKVLTGKRVVDSIGTQEHLKLQTIPSTELQFPVIQPPPPNLPPLWSVYDTSSIVQPIASYTQTASMATFTLTNSVSRNFTFYWPWSALQKVPPGSQYIITSFFVPGNLEGDEYDGWLYGIVPSNSRELLTVEYFPVEPAPTLNATTGQVFVTADPGMAGNPLSLALGIPPPAACETPNPAPGIHYKFSAVQPTWPPNIAQTPIPLPTVSGELDAIQLISIQAMATVIPTTSPVPPPPDFTDFRHDGPDLLYDLPVNFPSTKSWCSSDSPFTTLDGYSYLSRTDEFQTYFMFNPETKNSIWVPLALMTWGWDGTTSLVKGKWTAPSGAATPPAYNYFGNIAWGNPPPIWNLEYP